MLRFNRFYQHLLPVLVAALPGCSWQGPKASSVLVIAVDSLNFESVTCDGSPRLSGFSAICSESVRFTHAFTPSPLSQAVLASLLTGLYPVDHKVRHNGSDFLSARFVTSAEAAAERGFRTGFFSGGPPIWRKSGLSQGFEVFEDNVRVNEDSQYRPAGVNFENFLLWLDRTVGADRFFSFIYLADLQFPDAISTTDDFEERIPGFDSQMEEVSESLQSLIAGLRERGRWDMTHVVLVGLNGRSVRQRPREIEPINLYGENTQVVLFMKPARGPRDLGIEWKIDKNVSLVDVGVTLFGLVGAEAPRSSLPMLETASLAPVLSRPEATWAEDRLLLIESHWARWRGWGGARFALRKGHLLYLHDEPRKAFNTLIDRSESMPLPKGDPMFRELREEAETLFAQIEAAPWPGLPDSLVDKIQLGQELWREKEPTDFIRQRLEELVEARPWDQQLQGWLARVALADANWRSLERLGERFSHPAWTFVARRRLRNQDVGRLRLIGCSAAFLPNRAARMTRQECDDELFLSLENWLWERNPQRRAERQDEFVRQYLWLKARERVARSNFINALTWDSALDEPGDPSLADLYLSLPRNQSISNLVKKRILKEIDED